MRLSNRYIIRFIVFALILAGAVAFGMYRLSDKARANTEMHTTSTTWVAPAGVYSVQVEAWGGGGAGGGATGNPSGGGGGAGGAYAKKNSVTVVPGNSYTLTVGTGATGTTAAGASGNPSWFGTTGTVYAEGGAGGGLASTDSTSAAGAAGSSASSVGDVLYAGGSGGTGSSGASAGGGGESAGAAANGNNGVATTGGTGLADGGDGGAGGNTAGGGGVGNPGSVPGGGGGGGRAGNNSDRAGGSGADGKIVLTYTPVTTTLSDGTDPGNATIAPGTSATVAGTFKFQSSVAGNYPVSAVVVGLGTGASSGISLVEIVSDDGATVYGSASDPASDTPSVTLSTTTLNVTSTLTQYKIRITPKSHSNMAVPAGAAYSVTAQINSWTDSNAQAGSDTAGTTITIDNASPSGATSTSGSAGDAKVTLNWTTSASSDFSRSVVLRWTGSTPGSEVPAEGTDYSVGNTITTATVVCVRTSDAASTAVSGTDGNGGNCSATALTNSQAYSYKVFQKDSNGNYDVGTTFTGSPFTPVSGIPNPVTVKGSAKFYGNVQIK